MIYPVRSCWCAAGRSAAEAAITLRLAWYLVRWLRLSVAIRFVGIAILAFFFVGIIAIGVGYATGQPPSEYR